ncbi:MAG TPA: YcxB family protein [Cryptosporangiaceae bacterium]|nr:YcxB family protein [Cryptosporangiaceae bacterium]
MDIEATFALTPEEVSDGIRRALRRRIRTFTLFGVAVLVLAVLMWLAGSRLPFFVGMLASGVLLISMGPLLASTWVTRRIVKRAPHLVEERTVRLTDEGYHASVDGAASHTSWTRVQGIEESTRSWLFRLSPTQMMVVPKRALTDADNATFRQFVTEDYPRVSA